MKSPFAEPEIAFAWLVGVGATDKYVYTGDSLKRRMLRLKQVYAAKDGEGWKHDFSVAERYLDTAIKHLGKVPVVCLYVWEMNTGATRYSGANENEAGMQKGIPFTVLDPASGGFILFQLTLWAVCRTPITLAQWLGSGDQARGLTHIYNARGGVVLMMRNFWQQFPKAVEAGADGTLRLGVFPRETVVHHYLYDASAMGIALAREVWKQIGYQGG